MAAAPAAGSITPAHLGFLAIFNPSLGNTDETIDDQIVYYASVSTQSDGKRRRRARGSSRPTEGISQEERHERLRQIGLAQGMASFSRGFADGAAVDAIDTEKSRVILHELEPGWWILASIDLTKMPLPPRLRTKSGDKQEEQFEYSSREMKPANLLLADLLRAHNIFLMHHDTSLSALFVRSRRSRFVAILSKYWDLYLSTWNVLLHGNPAREVYGGINIAASGELGVGVGEEERGSGEREVLEGLVGRSEGLVDLIACRFGDPEPDPDSKVPATEELPPWLGTGQEPGSEDGAIFLGVGALSRKSLRDVTHWMEDLYTWGDHAYGLIESPTSIRRTKSGRPKQKPAPAEVSSEAPKGKVSNGQGKHSNGESTEAHTSEAQTSEAQTSEAQGDDGKLDKMVSYLKMGYGTYWSLPGGNTNGSGGEDSTSAESRPDQPSDPQKITRPSIGRRVSSFEGGGHYLIGLKGEIEEGTREHEHESEHSDGHDTENNSRTVLRTINVELETGADTQLEATIVKDFQHPASVLTQSQVMGNMVPGYNSHDLNKAKKLRVVVYVNRPFMFTFLFELHTDSLAWDFMYRSLHYQLAPLKKSLLASTSYRPEKPSAGTSRSCIHDLVWDPKSLSVYSNIPNIPEVYEPQESWSRADAISTHLHLLHIHSGTRTELERTQKTSRGWWIVWTRLLEQSQRVGQDHSAGLSTIREGNGSDAASSDGEDYEGISQDARTIVEKEILLIRRASDHVGFRSEGANGGDGPGRLVQGIGVDTRRYVEELLTLL